LTTRATTRVVIFDAKENPIHAIVREPGPGYNDSVDGNAATILVIAPPGRLRDSLCVVLQSGERIGFVDKVDNYTEGQRVLGERATTLIVLDLQEDTESLGRTLRWLKTEWPGIPCLVVAHNQKQEHQAQASGGDAVLQVGFSAETLFGAIADIMNRKIEERQGQS
jgi:DNA-binding NarL/FixJ family response regulator